MTALDRGKQLFSLRRKQVPPLAAKFAHHLCVCCGGCCSEVFITAYSIYAEVVENLPPADDNAYRATEIDRTWFMEKAA